MDRRESIKSLVLGSVAGGLALHGCNPRIGDNDVAPNTTLPETDENVYGRTPEEKAHNAQLNAMQFFNTHEMATLTVLCDLILPANENYRSASSVGVPDFIEFMVKDAPDFQTPIRGGLMWLDHEASFNYKTIFKDCTIDQQKEILDRIAYHNPEIPMEEHPMEIQFFALMRNLTLTGYYTSKEGISDLGYKGNTPNVWDGVPEDILKEHDLTYDEEWLAKCVDQDKRDVVATWDEQGNLLT